MLACVCVYVHGYVHVWEHVHAKAHVWASEGNLDLPVPSLHYMDCRGWTQVGWLVAYASFSPLELSHWRV